MTQPMFGLRISHILRGPFLSTFVSRLLQEKPDFNLDKAAIYSMLALCSMLIVTEKEMEHKILIDDLEELLLSLLKSSSILYTTVSREINYAYRHANGDELRHKGLVKLVKHRQQSPPSDIPLMEEIITREDLYRRLSVEECDLFLEKGYSLGLAKSG